MQVCSVLASKANRVQALLVIACAGGYHRVVAERVGIMAIGSGHGWFAVLLPAVPI